MKYVLISFLASLYSFLQLLGPSSRAHQTQNRAALAMYVIYVHKTALKFYVCFVYFNHHVVSYFFLVSPLV
jgi:hypothetical protein